ncbi:MAG: hypothetical protein NW224_26500 [Leptolyngbyaceae cyanobacterium bins.302]|nr:hypothetical protein [Leptolyngbyaceae cyanobacterium bins.302]
MTAMIPHTSKQSSWQTILVLVLAFWLSGSLLLDGLVMPALYAAGMMAEPGFASAGYSLFWIFNRVELVCAAATLSCVLVLRYARHPWNRPGLVSVGVAGLLFAIALIDTYTLTPSMSALGIHLNWLTDTVEVPAGMDQLHMSYWLLDMVKLLAGGCLLWIYNRAANPVSQA